ncbi:MAG: hypothetical protein NC253_12715 [Ruminococcus sp.]|nr:hypothetical protein [Ruminococcus sp.]MCM1479948.1 hypothetical protein [Muribaculaceae bacterium]
MPFFALGAGIYFIVTGITKKGRAYKSKMGTPLSEKEVKTVRVTYIIVGAVLLIVALISGIELFS